MYIIKVYKELKIWWQIRKVAKTEEVALKENGFRVDWIGRIYTVINLPEEVATAPISQEGYVLMKLREHDKFLLELNEDGTISINRVSGFCFLIEKIPSDDPAPLRRIPAKFEIKEDAIKSSLGLGHSYSRLRCTFDVNRQDKPIIQSIALVDYCLHLYSNQRLRYNWYLLIF